MSLKKRKIKRNLGKFTGRRLLMIIGIIILIVLIIISIPKNNYTFESGFNEIQKLDVKYSTNFKLEDLSKNGQRIPFENIDLYLNDLKDLRKDVYYSVKDYPTDDESALLLFIDARTLMLLSEKDYLIGETYGAKGLTSDKSGFSCSEAGYIINAGYYYNLSYSAGLQAYLKLDDLLGNYRDVQSIWSLVGIGKEKPNFMSSSLGDVKLETEKNMVALTKFCLINMSNGFSETVNPQDYLHGSPTPLLIPDNSSFKNKTEEKSLNITYPNIIYPNL